MASALPLAQHGSTAPFFLLVFALSVPLWAFGALRGGELMPGLPVAAIAFVVPVLAAGVLVYRSSGGAGLRAFLGRAFDARSVREPLWWLPTALLLPALWALSWVALVALERPLPEPRIALGSVPFLVLAFLFSGLVEELGWMGYAYPTMRGRWGSFGASLLLGGVWALWHGAPLVIGGREPAWIAWWALGTVATRVLQVWVFERGGGSVFAQAVMHASFNVSWQLFPNEGSHYDPAVLSVLLAAVALAVVALGGLRVRER